MSRRRSLPVDPKRSVFSQPVKPAATPPAKRVTVSLPAAVHDRLADAAHVEGFGVAARVAELVEAHVDTLEDERGKPYPRRPGRR